MITAKFNVKKLFFDRAGVKKQIDDGTRKALIRIGGYIRKVARNSMRKPNDPNKPSPPGKPPHAHGPMLLKEQLFFWYEKKFTGASVEIGPVQFNNSDLIGLMEFGGTRTNRYRRTTTGKLGRKKGGVRAPGEKRVIEAGTRLIYEPRPFMEPAFDKAKAAYGLSKYWEGIFRTA